MVRSIILVKLLLYIVWSNLSIINVASINAFLDFLKMILAYSVHNRGHESSKLKFVALFLDVLYRQMKNLNLIIFNSTKIGLVL